MEVILENKDYKYYEQKNVNEFYRKDSKKKQINYKRMNALQFWDSISIYFKLIYLESSNKNINYRQDELDIDHLIDKSSLSWSIAENNRSVNNLIEQNYKENLNSFSSNDDQIIYESSNYKVVNEYSKGQYFGEISCLTKYLPVTCTIRAISNSVWGVIQK